MIEIFEKHHISPQVQNLRMVLKILQESYVSYMSQHAVFLGNLIIDLISMIFFYPGLSEIYDNCNL
jgi:hypothetical protein